MILIFYFSRQYKKPPELVQFEKAWLEELNKIDCEDNKLDDCKAS